MVQIELIDQIGDTNYERLNSKMVSEKYGMASPVIQCFEHNKHVVDAVSRGAMLTAMDPFTGETYDFDYYSRGFNLTGTLYDDHILAKNPAPIETPLVFTLREWGYSVGYFDDKHTFAGILLAKLNVLNIIIQ
jgi:hypothetical protein